MSMTDEDKQRIIERAFSLGFDYEKNMRGCCQCTIAAVQDALGLRNDAVFKAGSGLTAGGGISCEGSCGAYTGGVMVMSSVFGRRRGKWDGDKDEKDCAHRMAATLLDKFKGEYGSGICNIIHVRILGRSFDLKDIRDREAFETSGAHVDKCTSVVAKAAAWAAELILEELSDRGIRLDELRKKT
jgi:C_GCAxxG_C_C family probable redox protein